MFNSLCISPHIYVAKLRNEKRNVHGFMPSTNVLIRNDLASRTVDCNPALLCGPRLITASILHIITRRRARLYDYYIQYLSFLRILI
jgi:hypothetical protein